ncbi:hypothetical protein NDK50_12455 [Paraburkholderia bryophila]|uniref:hypothetical protein n=1 Tax=Paraburkholderia bryophila TaxID=420952 RepID=UPI00234BD471|nr:hypothetical protein [Paraburkholderia bryophila]WCM18282.1 hypothetical protein NDK50_12455 [Paraburkholderia bryophila]
MKLTHKLKNPATAGPMWGVAFGIFMTIVSSGIWFYATSPSSPSEGPDESLAVAAALVGVFMAVYSTREFHHQRKRR